MVRVHAISQSEIEIRHIKGELLGIAFAVALITTFALKIDAHRHRVALTCYRHETDPMHTDTEDIDCVMQRDETRSSFELGRVSIHSIKGEPRRRAVGSRELRQMELWEVRLHRKYPANSAEIPFFRFDTRIDAEAAENILATFIQDALISDDDVDEIDLSFGPAVLRPWIFAAGGLIVSWALTRPCMEVATFDAVGGEFRLARWSGIGLRTLDVVHPLCSVARMSVADRVVAQRAGSFSNAQSLTVMFRSARGSMDYGQVTQSGWSSSGGQIGRRRWGSGEGEVSEGELTLGIGGLLFDPVATAKAVAQVQRLLLTAQQGHLPPPLVASPDGAAVSDGHQDPEIAAAGAEIGARGTAAGDGACAVCFVGRRDTVFIPCGHMHCCAGCASRVDECPICRVPITLRQRAYR